MSLLPLKKNAGVDGRHVLVAAVALQACAAHEPAARAKHDWFPETGFVSIELEGAGEVAWTSAFGTRRDDWVNRAIQLPDGDIVAVGFIDRGAEGPAVWDGFAHRLDGKGRARWTKRLGGPALDAMWSVRAAPDGRLALAGFSSSGGAGGTDQWLSILGPDGEPILERRFGDASNERATDLVSAADGGFLLVGQTDGSASDGLDVFVVRTDAGGEERWRRALGGPGSDRGFYGAATPDDGFVVAGVTGHPDAYDMLVLKLDAEGRELWRRTIGGDGNDPNHGIDVLPDGRIRVVGYAANGSSPEHDAVAVTLSAEGEVLTHELIGAPGDERVMSAVHTSNGATWLVGYTRSFGAGDWDVLLARVGVEGAFEPWLGAIGTAHDDHGTTVLETMDGQLVVGGYTTALTEGAGSSDLFLFQVDPETIVRRTEGVVVRSRPR